MDYQISKMLCVRKVIVILKVANLKINICILNKRQFYSKFIF